MLNVESLFKDQIIDLERLLLRKHRFLEIDSEQLVFLLNILNFYDYKNLALHDLYQKIPFSKSKIDLMLEVFLKRKLLKTVFLKDHKEVFLDLSELWRRLLNFYLVPDEDSSFNEKLNWFIEITGFEKNSAIVDKFEHLLTLNGWKQMVETINRIKESELENVNWQTFSSLYYELNDNSKMDRKKLQDVIEVNWLEG